MQTNERRHPATSAKNQNRSHVFLKHQGDGRDIVEDLIVVKLLHAVLQGDRGQFFQELVEHHGTVGDVPRLRIVPLVDGHRRRAGRVTNVDEPGTKMIEVRIRSFTYFIDVLSINEMCEGSPLASGRSAGRPRPRKKSIMRLRFDVRSKRGRACEGPRKRARGREREKRH